MLLYDAKKVFYIVTDPDFEHLRYLTPTISVEHLLDREAEDRGFQIERIAAHPSNRTPLCFSSRDQFQSIMVYRKSPGVEAWSRMIHTDRTGCFLHDAEENRKRVLDDPTH